MDEITKSRPRMRSTALPATYHIVAFSDEICGAPKVKIGKRFTESGHECLDIFAATAGLVQRILQEHVGIREFIDNREIARFSPKLVKPAADDGLVIVFLRHSNFLSSYRTSALFIGSYVVQRRAIILS